MRVKLTFAVVTFTLCAQVSDRARKIHQDAFVFDGHVHAIDREFYHGGDIGARKPDGMWDLPRAKEGGLDALFFSAYVPEEYYPGRFETKQALRVVDCALTQIAKNGVNHWSRITLWAARLAFPPATSSDLPNTARIFSSPQL